MGGGNPGDAGAGASDQRAARERYRNALFDREAGARGWQFFIGLGFHVIQEGLIGGEAPNKCWFFSI